MASEEDLGLVARILAGDVAALEEFISKYRSYLFGILIRHMNLPPAEADEVFQRFLFHIWEDEFRRLRSWSGKATLSAFIGKIARNLARDYRREQRATEDASVEEILDDPSPETEHRCDIEAALLRLSPRDRELIHRRYYLDETYRDIALALSMTVNNVGVALSRAQDRLKQILIGAL